MQLIDWTTPGVKITDFALMPAQSRNCLAAWATATYQGQEVILAFPASFRNIPHDEMTEVIIRECFQVRRMDLAESLLVAALGERFGKAALKHGQLSVLDLASI